MIPDAEAPVLGPTPTSKTWHFEAKLKRMEEVFMKEKVEADRRKTATMSGFFVSMQEGHIDHS